MPDQVEIPVETLQDKINDVREELEGSEHKDRTPSWITYLALTTALMAVLAAIAGLLEGRAADEALLKANDAVYYQAIAVDAWGEFQADSIKALNETNTAAVLGQVKAPAGDVEKHTAEAKRRKNNQAQSRTHAEEAGHERDMAREESNAQSVHRQRYSFAVTLFQVGIGLSAVAALMRIKALWYASLVGAALGLVLLTWGLLPVHGHAVPLEGAATPGAVASPAPAGTASLPASTTPTATAH